MTQHEWKPQEPGEAPRALPLDAPLPKHDGWPAERPKGWPGPWPPAAGPAALTAVALWTRERDAAEDDTFYCYSSKELNAAGDYFVNDAAGRAEAIELGWAEPDKETTPWTDEEAAAYERRQEVDAAARTANGMPAATGWNSCVELAKRVSLTREHQVLALELGEPTTANPWSPQQRVRYDLAITKLAARETRYEGHLYEFLFRFSTAYPPTQGVNSGSWTPERHAYLLGTVREALVTERPVAATALLTATDLMTRPDPAWVIDRVLPANVLGALHGAPDSGKTFLELDWALHIATGLPWQGRAVTKGAALYVITEGEDWFKLRIASWCTAHRVDSADLAASFLLEPVNLLDESSVSALLDAVGDRQLAFVVFDTLIRNMPGGNENATEDMGAVIAAADRVRRATNAHAQFVTHEPHAAPGRMRGSTSLPGAVRVAYRLANDGVGNLTLTCTKLNDGPKPAPLALRLTPVDGSMVIDADAGQRANPEEAAVLAALDGVLGYTAWWNASGLRSKKTFNKHVVALIAALRVAKDSSGDYYRTGR